MPRRKSKRRQKHIKKRRKSKRKYRAASKKRKGASKKRKRASKKSKRASKKSKRASKKSKSRCLDTEEAARAYDAEVNFRSRPPPIDFLSLYDPTLLPRPDQFYWVDPAATPIEKVEQDIADWCGYG